LTMRANGLPLGAARPGLRAGEPRATDTVDPSGSTPGSATRPTSTPWWPPRPAWLRGHSSTAGQHVGRGFNASGRGHGRGTGDDGGPVLKQSPGRVRDTRSRATPRSSSSTRRARSTVYVIEVDHMASPGAGRVAASTPVRGDAVVRASVVPAGREGGPRRLVPCEIDHTANALRGRGRPRLDLPSTRCGRAIGLAQRPQNSTSSTRSRPAQRVLMFRRPGPDARRSSANTTWRGWHRTERRPAILPASPSCSE